MNGVDIKLEGRALDVVVIVLNVKLVITLLFWVVSDTNGAIVVVHYSRLIAATGLRSRHNDHWPRTHTTALKVLVYNNGLTACQQWLFSNPEVFGGDRSDRTIGPIGRQTQHENQALINAIVETIMRYNVYIVYKFCISQAIDMYESVGTGAEFYCNSMVFRAIAGLGFHTHDTSRIPVPTLSYMSMACDIQNLRTVFTTWHLGTDVTFEYFVSGFAISGDAIDDSNTSCSDGRQQCVDELSNKSRLTLILGPKRDNSSPQQYRTYRFNGREFDTNVADIPLGLERNGTTNKWFTPSALITGTYRQKHKQIIAINYNEKSINRLNVLELSSRHGVIGNRYWEPVVHYLDIKSHYYHLIDIKVSSSERQTLLITEQMVYQLMDNNTLRELMHPWQLFGCESLAHSVSLRSGSDGGHGSDGQQLNQKLLAGEGHRISRHVSTRYHPMSDSLHFVARSHPMQTYRTTPPAPPPSPVADDNTAGQTMILAVGSESPAMATEMIIRSDSSTAAAMKRKSCEETEEDVRREERKRRNRESAAKCRKKLKERMDSCERDVHLLRHRNQALRNEKSLIELEFRNLQQEFGRHLQCDRHFAGQVVTAGPLRTPPNIAAAAAMSSNNGFSDHPLMHLGELIFKSGQIDGKK
ncbi:unnamed protein product [Medioppia subpectinata]|uniref:BZIP domain-containing protein n=1 Tax=Medioppia subpectinata TaxID=1979941 RepID=A0A7R9KND3_9ACAR|nr:unnamed protein product [Medioppia subpectinata]CAG2105606.1 unnamed protein product [Medioppia subpectinata]